MSGIGLSGSDKEESESNWLWVSEKLWYNEYVSVCLSVCVSVLVCLPACLTACIYVCMKVRQSVSVCLSVCLCQNVRLAITNLFKNNNSVDQAFF